MMNSTLRQPIFRLVAAAWLTLLLLGCLPNEIQAQPRASQTTVDGQQNLQSSPRLPRFPKKDLTQLQKTLPRIRLPRPSACRSKTIPTTEWDLIVVQRMPF